MNKNILLGKGLENLPFGISKEEFEKTLGKPDDIEIYEDDEYGITENWHYDAFELSATFEDVDGLILTNLAVSSPEFTFDGSDFINRSLEEVIQQIELLDLGEIEIDNMNEEGEEDLSQIMVSIPDVSLNLWFDDGVLTEILWAPFWDEEEEEFIWPE